MVFDNSKLNKVLLQQFHKLILLHYEIGTKGIIHSHILLELRVFGNLASSVANIIAKLKHNTEVH